MRAHISFSPGKGWNLLLFLSELAYLKEPGYEKGGFISSELAHLKEPGYGYFTNTEIYTADKAKGLVLKSHGALSEPTVAGIEIGTDF